MNSSWDEARKVAASEAAEDTALELLQALWRDGGISASNIEDDTLPGRINAFLAELGLEYRGQHGNELDR